MTPDQIALVRETTAELVQRAPAGVEQFYARLFELDASLRPMFPDDLVEQQSMFLSTLVAVAAGLDDLDVVDQHASALGIRHHGYGVEAHQYVIVRSALLDAFSATLGDRFTAAHRQAWVGAYNLIAELMQQAPGRLAEV